MIIFQVGAVIFLFVVARAMWVLVITIHHGCVDHNYRLICSTISAPLFSLVDMISRYQAVTEFEEKKHTLRLSSLFLPQVWEGGVRTPAFVHYPRMNNTGCFGSYKIGNFW